MSPQFVEVKRRTPSDDGGATAFRQEWLTLLQRVSRRFYWLDRARIEDAIADAILRWLQQDGGGDGEVHEGTRELPVRSLYGEACRNVCHSVRMDKRRYRREREYVRRKKISSHGDFSVQNEPSVGHIYIEKEREELERLVEGCRAWEQAFVMLRNQGIKDLTDYAKVLNVEPQSLAEQQRAVGRAWNCIRMKLRRLKEKRAKSE